MSLEKIDTYIKELHIIKDHARVVKERDEALAKIDEIKNRPAAKVQDLIEKIYQQPPYKCTEQEIQDGMPELMKKIKAIIDKRVSFEADMEIFRRKVQGKI